MPKTNWICRKPKSDMVVPTYTTSPPQFPSAGSLQVGNHGGSMSGQGLGHKVPSAKPIVCKIAWEIENENIVGLLLCLFSCFYYYFVLFCFRLLRHLYHYFRDVDCASAMKVNRKHGNRHHKRNNPEPHQLGRVRLLSPERRHTWGCYCAWQLWGAWSPVVNGLPLATDE